MPVKLAYIRFIFEKGNKIHCQIEKGAMIASHENVKALSGGLNPEYCPGNNHYAVKKLNRYI